MSLTPPLQFFRRYNANMTTCSDPRQFAATVGPVCGARGFQSRECRDVVREALRRHGNECLATPIVPGWPPLVRYVCPSTDDYLGPLCPTHEGGGTAPTVANVPAPVRRGRALPTAALATLVAGTGIGLSALGVAKYKLDSVQRGLKAGTRDSANRATRVAPSRKTDQDDVVENDAIALVQLDSAIGEFSDVDWSPSGATGTATEPIEPHHNNFTWALPRGALTPAGLNSTIEIAGALLAPRADSADDILTTVKMGTTADDVIGDLRKRDDLSTFVDQNEDLIRQLHQGHENVDTDAVHRNEALLRERYEAHMSSWV